VQPTGNEKDAPKRPNAETPGSPQVGAAAGPRSDATGMKRPSSPAREGEESERKRSHTSLSPKRKDTFIRPTPPPRTPSRDRVSLSRYTSARDRSRSSSSSRPRYSRSTGREDHKMDTR
jgi:hypothetical protein